MMFDVLMFIGVVVIGVITFYMGYGVGYFVGKVSKSKEQ
jgi:uncharacterized membrane protein SpoIIM required for sporulation